MQTNPTLWRPGLPVIFPEALVLQLVEKLQAEGLRRSGRIPKEVAILLVGATLCPGRLSASLFQDPMSDFFRQPARISWVGSIVPFRANNLRLPYMLLLSAHK